MQSNNISDVANILERAWHAWVFVDICNESEHDAAVAELEAAEARVAQILREPGELWVTDTKSLLSLGGGWVLVDGVRFDISDTENIYKLWEALGLQP